MSKIVKTIASVALPIIGTLVAPGVGTFLGSTLSAGTLGAIGGALGGAIGGGLNGGIPGAVLGAVGGYASSGGISSIAGNAAGSSLATTAGNAALQGPTYGSGVIGAVTGGGARALGSTVAGVASDATSPLFSGLTTVGNQLMAQNNADTALEAAKTQSGAVDRAIAQTQPYTQAGQDALAQIQTINKDPSGYVKNNPLYTSLADEAQRRLLANQAAKGKVGSGGTASALQDQLLQIGNGLVQQQVGNLQGVANAGQNAATNTAGLITDQGRVNAAGQVGAANAYTQGYQNQINTLLALQNLNKSSGYAPVNYLQA